MPWPQPTCAEDSASRSARRYHLVALGMVTNVGSRGASMMLMVLTVYWAAPYLGPERFGIWAIFSGFAAMLSFLDLGAGNALINRVATVSATGDIKKLQNTVAGGVGWMIVLGVASATLLSIVFANLPWNVILKLTDDSLVIEARHTAIVFSGLFGLHIISSGLYKILGGQQLSYEANLLQVLSTLLAGLSLWWSIHQEVGIAGLLAAIFGVQSALGFIVIPLLRRRGIFRFKGIFSSMLQERASLFKTGSHFFLLQIGMMIGWGSDNLIVAGLVGTKEVATFVIAQRLFQFASQPVAVLNAPLWSAYADAHAHGERAFIRQSLLKALVLSTSVGGTLTLVLAMLGEQIIPLWTKGAVVVPWSLLILFATWTLLEIFGTVFGVYLNGCGVVREQVIVVIMFCVVAIPLKIILTTYAGPPGLVGATIVAYCCTVVLAYATFFRNRVLGPLLGPIEK